MKSKRSTTKSDPTRAIAYLRVSTSAIQQELGIQAQRQAIEAWAKREGVEVVAVYAEEISGGAALEKRAVLLEAIGALRTHRAGLLVVQRLDRFSRDPLSAAMAELEISRVGARVVCADGVGNGNDPASQLMRDVGLGVARFERAMIATRTKAAMTVKRARGENTGTPPYGWRVGDDRKTLVPDEHEQRVLAAVRGLRERGLSFRGVVAQSTRLGLVGRTGRAFTLQAVYNMAGDVEVPRRRDHPTSARSATRCRSPRDRACVALEASPPRRAAALPY
ncbi:MAG: recombinase family protein [Candidatus Eisenbacteria bacterium]|nr:recombinase family protein [Candidatus Eisenbacteria bacterium]